MPTSVALRVNFRTGYHPRWTDQHKITDTIRKRRGEEKLGHSKTEGKIVTLINNATHVVIISWKTFQFEIMILQVHGDCSMTK